MLALIPASPSAAADPPGGTAAPAPADSVVAPPELVPISEIPRRLDESRQVLRDLAAELETTAADSTMATQIDALRESLDDLLEGPVASNPEHASGRALRDLEGDALRRQAKLADWARALERDAGALSERREVLQESRATWDRTRKRLADEELASGLLGGVDSLITYYGTVGDQLDESYSAMLELRTGVSGQTDRLSGLLASLAQARQSGFLGLLRPDSPPLWTDLPAAGEAGEKAKQLSGSWEEAIAPLAPFLEDNIPALVAHAFLFAGLLAVILVARARRQRWEEEGDSGSGAPSIVDRPVAAALIGALLFTRLLYPFAPTIVGILVRVVSIVPLLLLVPRILPQRYVALSWTVAVLFLIDTAEFLFLGDPALHRLHLLVVAGLGLASALVFLRRTDAVQGENERRVRRWAGALAVLAFAASCITNVYGATELAALCSDAVLRVLYLSIVVIVGARVMESFVGIALRIAPLRHLRSVRVHGALIERRLGTVVRLVLLFLWCRAVLSFFGAERSIVDLFLAVMNLGGTFGAVTLTVGHFVAFFLTLWISFQISRFLQFALGEDILPQVTLPRGVPQTITRLTHYGIVTLGFLLAVAATGFDLSKLAILAGGLGVGVGFGLQSIVNNFISGLILMFERPVQIGDTIEVGTLIGRVQNIGIRASTVRTYSGAEVVVPNANLVSNEVINWTLSDRRRRIEVPVGVAYGSDPEQVRELLLTSASEHEDVLETPSPVAFFLGFGESALEFELRFWTREFDEWQRVRGEVAAAIQRLLTGADIEIPFPQRTIHVRSEAPAPAKHSAPAETEPPSAKAEEE